jgi:pSer/pThr/pTyr-binding forkhead associated (FHA) protein
MQAQSGLSIHTTLNIAPSSDTLQANERCQAYLKQIEPGDICFILEKNQTPIVSHNVSETILGRFFDELENGNLDLDPHGAGAAGVSRRHARIIRINEQFIFEDLNSTNGSWLNGQRISAGTTYPLTCGDQIWLGQFKLQVCFHQAETIPTTILFLRDTTSSERYLTPHVLLTQIGPYLTAIAALQQIAADCLEQDATELIIEKLDASGSDSYILVHIAHSPEAIHLIRKWISPWRREQQHAAETRADTSETKQAMVQLTSKIIADLAPGLSNESRFTLIEKAIPTVTELATGSIELYFEAL